MNPILHIRKNVFQLSQADFASIAGSTQASVSRWERDELEPSRSEMERIRCEASQRGLAWDDRWFFETPTSQDTAA